MNIDENIFRMPIYPMLNHMNIDELNISFYVKPRPLRSRSNDPIILASDWSRAVNIVMNIDENIFRMPIYPMLNHMNIDELNIFVLGQATPNRRLKDSGS